MTAAPWLTDEAVRVARTRAALSAWDLKMGVLASGDQLAVSLDALAEAAWRARSLADVQTLRDLAAATENRAHRWAYEQAIEALLPQPERSKTP